MDSLNQINLDNIPLNKDTILSQLEKAAKNPLLKGVINKLCEKVKSNGWTDNDVYKANCSGQNDSGSGQAGSSSGTMINQVTPIFHNSVFILIFSNYAKVCFDLNG